MGGGDLNMKKSWHPLLLKNQERVWLEEKKALEEKKKLEQLRKEKEEERQLQELQRLQEEKTGKKRAEKLEWMYATPATGTNQNSNDLEDYLLGKKRVDKILTADDNAKVGASHKNFIAIQNANNARDVAAKIREDPLLAIKQQEQAAYQTLLSNPLRLRELQERNGIKPKKDKKDKKERKREKEERRRLKEGRRDGSRSRSQSPSRYQNSRPEGPSRSYRSRSPPARRSRSPGPSRSHREYEKSRYHSRSRSPQHSRRDEGYRPNAWSRSDESEEDYRRARERTPPRDYGKRHRSPTPDRDRDNRSQFKRSRTSHSPPPPPRPSQSTNASSSSQDRAARLAAMSNNATFMTVERKERLAGLLEKEKAELDAEAKMRAKSKGMGNFISQEQKRVFGGQGGLEDRIKRGRGGMVVDAD